MALPKDELELISKKLTFALDYTRFRSVCKSWRSAAPKRPQLPWLISYLQTDSDENIILVNFYHFSFETNKITRIRELSDWPLVSSFIDKSTVCIGSSRGWLALVNNRTSSVSIFNPLTNSTINLPNLPNNVFSYDISSYILTSDPGESLSDCFALIYGFNWISYCKVGSNGWIELMPHPEIDMYSIHIQICCYQGKLFIASLGDVFLCDFSQNHSVFKIVSVDSNDTAGMGDFELERSWLVESDGDLLLVLFYSTGYDDDCDDDMYFWVFKLDFEPQLVKLAEIKSLGEKTLFLSQKIAFTLTASKYPGCKENSIHYSLIHYDSVKSCINQTLIVFDFERLSGGPMIGNLSCFMKRDSFGLFQPSLLWSSSGSMIGNLRRFGNFPVMKHDNCAWFQPSLLI